MPIDLYPNIAKVKRGGVYQNLPGFVQQSGDADIKAMIANSESSTTAQYAHAEGSYFILNDVLYKALINIAVNNTIAVGTNCEVAILGNDVSEIENDVNDLKTKFSQFAETQETLTGDYIELDYNGGTVITTVNNVREQTEIKLGVSKGNILCLPYFRPNNYTTNGLTFTINADKSITVNGTATDDTFYNIAYYQNPLLFSIDNAQIGRQYGYYIKGCTDGSDSTYYLIERQNGIKCKTTPAGIWSASPSNIVNLCLWVANGVTLTNKTFYPMLCLTGTEEWTPPITPYTVTVESSQTSYTFEDISLDEGYNVIVTNGKNTLSVNVDGYYNLEEMQNEIDSLEEKVGNVWEGKKWVAFGTSITDNYSQNSYITQGEHAGEHTGKYVPYLLDLSKLSESDFVNRGISGGSINGHILYYIRYYTSDEANADLITIEGAVNDFARAIPLGNVGDTVPYTDTLLPDGTADGTFAGACYQAFTTALTNSPKAVVVLLTETTGKNHVGYADYSQTRKNELDLTQWDYIDMTIKVAEFVGIPVIKCGQDSMINAQNPQYIADHIHHTYLGGYQYARTIWSKLKGIPLKALSVPD